MSEIFEGVPLSEIKEISMGMDPNPVPHAAPAPTERVVKILKKDGSVLEKREPLDRPDPNMREYRASQ